MKKSEKEYFYYKHLHKLKDSTKPLTINLTGISEVKKKCNVNNYLKSIYRTLLFKESTYVTTFNVGLQLNYRRDN